ncbi:HlyD family efflux transporter periplasmic adaptor subunit [Cellulomonas humilata]|uniref:HlyD family efflux transporter periplasmic adaptor subunit n=2 Tax=Cellulomonas humilata TaxID=144055 RepID=A0A7Y5ZXP7_9CELL|nr:HlyD family efflux transporter periplasmic adaptor subunit [Cellulomonas humilata]NUU16063.1 HlyD family efflux transporter periplasmic adaptor subunit [Cellulomonas humilata]
MQHVWRRTTPLTRTVAAVVVVALVGAGVWWFGIRDASAASAAPVTRTVAASLTTMQKSVSGSGTLAPSVQQDVSFEVSGTVTGVPVAVGQSVTVGQTLATVDTLQLNADLLQAKSTLASAQAKLDDASGTAQIAAAQAQVDVAQSGVDTAQAAMDGATLTAPVAGLLTAVDLEVGDAVGSSSAPTGSGGETTAQFTIVGTDAWQVDVTVSDADIALIEVGDQAEVTLDGATEPVFGTISEIGLLSTSDTGVAAYPVTVAVTGDQEGLHDGVAAEVELVYERRTDVLTVPSLAVTTATDGTTTVTQVDAAGATVDVPVTTGETSGNVTEITEGLAEGDEVVLATFTPGSGGTGRQGTTQDGGGTFPEGGPPEGFDPTQMQGGQTNG